MITRFQWHMMIGELCWAIELNVMFKRWGDARHIEILPSDQHFFRSHWVKMCMRLGDFAAHRIISSPPGTGKIEGGEG